jgi:hypothetical protein
MPKVSRGEAQSSLAARGHDDLLGPAADATRRREIFGDRRAQCGFALRVAAIPVAPSARRQGARGEPFPARDQAVVDLGISNGRGDFFHSGIIRRSDFAQCEVARAVAVLPSGVEATAGASGAGTK